MPSHILLILVVGGIAGIALLLHLLGLSAAPPLTRQAARSAWLRHYPDLEPTDIALSDDGRAARVVTAQGTGLVWLMGADTTARLLRAPHLRPHRKGLRVRLDDPGAPALTLVLNDLQRADWTKALTAT